MREQVRQRVFAAMDPMLDAQIANSMGIKYLVVRSKAGQFIRRVDENMDPERIAKGEEIVEVWLKDPSVQAFTDLMNRAIDKPTEMIQQEVSLTIRGLDERLRNARKRLSGKHS